MMGSAVKAVRVESLLRSDMALLGKLGEAANSTFNIAAEPANAPINVKSLFGAPE